MAHFSKFISSRSTLFGFIAVILLSATAVIALLIQVDVWSRASFDMLKNNTQQVRLVMIMRDAVQKRELAIQRMLNLDDAFERDAESELFHKLAGIYIQARQSLTKTVMDDALRVKLKKLDVSVAYAYPYHEGLVEALVFDDFEQAELGAVVLEGRKASSQVLYLLDQIIENQDETHNHVVTDYESSRKFTLIVIGAMFTIIALVAIFALRTSGRQFKHISRLSILDDVSGTYNRRYFDMVLEEEWMRSMREYTPLSLLMVDIDYFKAYNDSFGHQMGDVCLFTIGKVLSGQLKRTTDFTARYGGEEFVIVLPNTSVEYARLLAERLRRSVEESRIKAGDEEVSPWVTVSIGLATTTAEYEQSSAVLIKAADSCLYASKRGGRNRVTDVMVDELN